MRDFTPHSRRKNPEPRIHEELTDTARVRLSRALSGINGYHIKLAHRRLIKYAGRRIIDTDSRKNRQFKLELPEVVKHHEDTDLFWDFLEYLINTAWSSEIPEKLRIGSDKIIEMAADIESILAEEGILIQMKPSVDEMKSYDGYRPDEHEWVKFQPVSDETVIDADQETRALAMGETWEEPLRGYNEAWNLYSDGTFTYVIAEKLYNSLEAVCEKICVELEDWGSESDTVGDYLSTMREKGLFEPNDAMVGEWQQIQGGLQVGVQKLGDDRKRHEEIDQDYAILLLHQTSAFLSFVIKRYEAKYG
jgi:hypothetical protein